MQTFVINLDSRQDRLRFTTEQLKDISWERFPGINGYNMTAYDFASKGYIPFFKWKDPMLNRTLTDTEIATAMSHYRLWEKCAQIQENVLILEDDNLYLGGLDIAEIDILLETYDIVYLDYKEMYPVKSIDIDDKFVKPYYPYWNNAYALSPRLATKIVESKFLNCIIPADEFFPLISGVDYNETCLGYREQFFELQEIYKNLIPTKPIAYKTKIFNQLMRPVLGSDVELGNCIMGDKRTPIHLLTVATDTSKLSYLEKSAEKYYCYYNNIGSGITWNGGDMSNPGGGQKINLMKNQLQYYDDNDIILFVDGYDVFLINNLEEIKNRFVGRCNILFAAEVSCWPDESIASMFDFNTQTKYKYLNSGCYIGYVKDLKRLMSDDIADSDDDQLYFQKKYLDNVANPVDGYTIEIDIENYIFQCLAGAVDAITIIENGVLVNTDTNCCPCVIHGNGGNQHKTYFDNLFNKFFKRFD
jgi:hypothetical protein